VGSSGVTPPIHEPLLLAEAPIDVTSAKVDPRQRVRSVGQRVAEAAQQRAIRAAELRVRVLAPAQGFVFAPDGANPRGDSQTMVLAHRLRIDGAQELRLLVEPGVPLAFPGSARPAPNPAAHRPARGAHAGLEELLGMAPQPDA